MTSIFEGQLSKTGVIWVPGMYIYRHSSEEIQVLHTVYGCIRKKDTTLTNQLLFSIHDF